MSYRELKIKLIKDWTEDKLELSDKWISNIKEIRSRVFKKGEVVLVNFGENLGSEQNSDPKIYRPAIVLSKDKVNHGILVIAPLTTKDTHKVYEFQSLIKASDYSFLRDDSKIMLDQCRTVSSVRVQTKIGTITQQDMNIMDLAIISLFEMDYLIK